MKEFAHFEYLLNVLAMTQNACWPDKITAEENKITITTRPNNDESVEQKEEREYRATFLDAVAELLDYTDEEFEIDTARNTIIAAVDSYIKSVCEYNNKYGEL